MLPTSLDLLLPCPESLPWVFVSLLCPLSPQYCVCSIPSSTVQQRKTPCFNTDVLQNSRDLQVTIFLNKDCSPNLPFIQDRNLDKFLEFPVLIPKWNYIYYWSFLQKILVCALQIIFIKVHRSSRARSNTARKELSLGNPETSVPGWRKMHFCTQDLNLRFWPWREFSRTNSWDLSFLSQIDPYPITAYRSEKTRFPRDSTATCNSSQETALIRRPGLMLFELHHGELIPKVSSIRRSWFFI